MRVVHKFGGTSVGSADRIAATASLIQRTAASEETVVVASAMSGVTNQLVEACRLASAGASADALKIVASIVDLHREAAAQLGTSVAVIDECLALLTRVETLVRAAAVIGSVDERSSDWIQCVGEKLSIRLLAERLRSTGTPAFTVDADTFLDTDSNFGAATPLQGLYERGVRNALEPGLAEGKVLVVTGFCGRASDGSTTTLGRGGSDYSATLLGAALSADRVLIWTDVSGVYTADPRVESGARVVPQLNYREAGELAYYGAKVLHPRTLKPVAGMGIPVEIRNSFEPEDPGTLIDRGITPGSHPVKAISAIRSHSLVSIEGTGMAGVPGVAARLFGALAQAEISVTMISQSSAESSICVGVPASDANAAEMAIRREFRLDIAHGDVEDVRRVPSVGLIAAVGLGMAHVPGIAGRVTATLGQAGFNVLAIAQGSSELNITFAVADSDVDASVRALHAEFGLHQVDTGDAEAAAFDIVLLGWGNIARELAELVERRNPEIEKRFGVRGRVVAISDRSGFWLRPSGIPLPELTEAAARKAAGHSVSTLPGALKGTLSDAVDAARSYRLVRPVLVDLTDGSGSEELFEKAFASKWDVVTANKKPLASAPEAYAALLESAERAGRTLRAEATVGAGLPVVDTLDMLLVTGDSLVRADGCLSGTLAFVLGQVEAGEKFSDAVREAHRRGYTEPDPYADLSGADVARKSIIISRIAEFAVPLDRVDVEGLVPAELEGLPLETFFEKLTELDDAVAERATNARDAGKVLRYVGQVFSDRIQVGPLEVPIESPLGRLAGTDNMIVFHSDRYSNTPLVVQGPGAGVDVTAMGVLGDIVRIVAERS